MPEKREVAETEIVGQEEDDVRPNLGSSGGRERPNEENQNKPNNVSSEHRSQIFRETDSFIVCT